jgi:hypothetical protein
LKYKGATAQSYFGGCIKVLPDHWSASDVADYIIGSCSQRLIISLLTIKERENIERTALSLHDSASIRSNVSTSTVTPHGFITQLLPFMRREGDMKKVRTAERRQLT